MNKILSNGIKMPLLGLGTFLAQNGESAYHAVSYALKVGYRHIDTAQMYQNEESIGQAIQDSSIPRKDIFITTKQRYHSTLENMQKMFDESLAKLKTDYVDLYLIHWPNHDKKINQQSWAFFEKIYKEGKAKAIGVSNFTKSHLIDLFETATIKPMVNQVELHPGLTQKSLKAFLDQEGIAIQSYGPFMRGGIFESPFKEKLEEIAEKYHATVPQIVVAWGVCSNVIMIPKSVTPERILENFKGKDIILTEEEIESINQLNRGKRIYTDPDNSPWGPYRE
jgi:diketogulonate reductase-like aldo/keto reductase